MAVEQDANKKEAELAKFLVEFEHPKRDLVFSLRTIIHEADPTLTEHIKWKAPSFCDAEVGDDRLTFNLHKPDQVLLIFHTGAKGKDTKGQGQLFHDETGLLQWLADKRAAVSINNPEDLAAKKDNLIVLIKRWIAATKIEA